MAASVHHPRLVERSIMMEHGQTSAERARRAVILIFLSTALTLSASADLWYEHYARAEDALAAEDWNRAVAEINEALERKGDSGARVRSYGMKVIAYFPYLKLGIAYFNLGQLDVALQAFETERQLGAIEGSAEDLATLERFQWMAIEEKQRRDTEARNRIDRIVRDAITESDLLERQGRLDDAIEALGRGLAVDPENAEAATRMVDLRDAISKRDRRRQLDTRVNDLMAQGNRFMIEKRFSEAASIFRQILALSPDPEVGILLARAEEKLRLSIAATPEVADTPAVVSTAIQDSLRLESEGRIEEALDHLQPALALDPDNAEARSILNRLLVARQQSVDSEAVQLLLEEADREFDGGRFEASLSVANRALALDPGNSIALTQVTRSYGEIGRRLLGASGGSNIPPAIRFADFRQEQKDGSRQQRVRNPDFRLSGVTIDNSPVSISIFDDADTPIEATVSAQPVGEYFVTEFTVEHSLAPGLSMLRVVATDPEGSVTSSEYQVFYSRPWYQSPWLPAAAVASILLTVGSVTVSRRRKRSRLISRRFNPYIAGAPVLDEKLFFGRERLIDRILQTIHNNSLLLHGERRIGKTSLQHHIKKRLEALEDPDFRFYPVYIDLQGTPEDRFFATMAEDILQDLAPHLNGLQPIKDPSGDSEYGYRDFVAELRRVIKTLKDQNEKKVKLVLLIDEVDELNQYDPRINQKLRSLFMKNFAENLVSVVSGVQIKKHWDREGSPWYNFFEEIEVTPFSREDAISLIRRPIGGVFRIDDDLVDRIISLTDGKPYLIQKHCIALVNRVHDHKRTTITLADVEAVGRPEAS